MSNKDGFLRPYQYDYELAKMADAIYEDEATIRKSMEKTNPDERLLPDDWRILGEFEDTNAKTGFVAGAFWNPGTKQIVIAYRGSEPDGPTAHGLIDYKGANVAIAKDGDVRGITDNLALRAGVQALARQHAPDWHAQFEQGLNYAERILKQSQTMPGGPYTVHVTGHSLAGAVAQVTHEMFDLPGRTFDPGGAQNLVQSHEFKAWRSEYYSSRDDGLRRADRDPEGRDFSNYLVNDSLVSRYSGPHIGRVEDMTGYGGRETLRDKAPYHLKNTLDGPVGAIGGAFDVVELHDMDRIIRVFKEAHEVGELNRVGALAPEQMTPTQSAHGFAHTPTDRPPIPEHLRDFRHAEHPRHEAYQRFMQGLEKLSPPGITPDQHECIAASFTAAQGTQPYFAEIGRLHQDKDGALWASNLPPNMYEDPRWVKIDLADTLAQAPEAQATRWREQHVPAPAPGMTQAQAQTVDPQQLQPTDMRHPGHPRHEMFTQVRGALSNEYDRWGLMRDPAQLDRETAQVVVEARDQRITKVGEIQLSFPRGSTQNRPTVTLLENPANEFTNRTSLDGNKLAQAPQVDQTSVQLQQVEQQVALIQQQEMQQRQEREMARGQGRSV